MTEPLDRLAIRMAGRSIPPQWPHPHHASEAEELMGHPDFFSDGIVAPDDLSFKTATEFRFGSPVATPWRANNVVHGRMFCCGGRWERRPTVILLHGWNSEPAYRWLFPLLAWRLNRFGVNAVAIVLPYHGPRRPREPGAIRDYISHDVLRMVEAARQSVADVRAVVSWLVGRGNTRLGVWGISLGGWLAGLLASKESRLSFSVLMTPVVRMDRALEDLECCAPIRRTLEGVSVPLELFNLFRHPSPASGVRVLLIAGEHDLFAPMETVEELGRRWSQAELWRYPHGHISMLGSFSVMERTLRWIRRVA